MTILQQTPTPSVFDSFRGAPFHLDDESISWVAETLADFGLDDKLGQLFVQPLLVGDPSEIDRLADVAEPGGFMVRPMAATDVQGLAAHARRTCAVPPLLAANLDRGGDGVVREGTTFASNLGIGATGDVRHATNAGHVAAREALAVGINWNFGPVVDLDLNDRNPITNTRTFGSDPTAVAAMSRAYLEAQQLDGIAACAKHWPGDGVDDRDQHLHPTINALSETDWSRSYGAVWSEVIDAGVLSIMVGHIALPAVSASIAGIEPRDARPATFAHEITTTLLRDRLGFAGLTVTDATLMGGFRMTMPRADAVPAAVAAGCDVFLFSTDYASDHAALRAGVESGVLTLERVDEAVARVLALKAHLGLHRPQDSSAALGHRVDHEAWARACAADAITVVKDLDETLPLDVHRHQRVLLYPLDGPGMHSDSPARIAEGLRGYGFSVDLFQYPQQVDFASIVAGTDVVSADRIIADYDLVLYVASVPTKSNQTTVRLSWAPLSAGNLPHVITEVPTVFVSMENPYHLRDVPRIRTYVNAYTDSPATADAVVDALIGRAPATGTNPVDPFCGYEDTHW